jgi:hypothetical protein
VKKLRAILGRIPLKRILICVIINAALYVCFVALDIADAAGLSVTPALLPDVLKYAAIVSCLMITLFATLSSRAQATLSSRAQARDPWQHRRSARIQSVVFAITLVSDFLLLFTDHFAAGLLVFLFAHLTALFRYRPRWVPLFAAAAGALCLAALIARRSSDPAYQALPVILLCAAYAVLIIGVTISTFHAEQPRINTLFSRIGMILFLCCDVNVFLSNLLTAGDAFNDPARILMWVFYLPAQTLLALSAVPLPLQPKNSI